MEDEACHGETLLLQGVVDCYFEEPDGIVLVDYKTDYVAPGMLRRFGKDTRCRFFIMPGAGDAHRKEGKGEVYISFLGWENFGFLTK